MGATLISAINDYYHCNSLNKYCFKHSSALMLLLIGVAMRTSLNMSTYVMALGIIVGASLSTVTPIATPQQELLTIILKIF